MRLRIALVGFGRLAQDYYAPALKILEPDAQYFVVDPNPKCRHRALEIFGGQECFGEVHQLTEKAIDAALIASPPTTHFTIWRTLASKYVPMFMEKPFPLASELPLVDSAPRSSGAVVINFNRRFWPPYQRFLGYVRAGVVGTPHTVFLNLVVDQLRWNAVTDHRSTAKEGGVLHDLGGHVVDLACSLFSSNPTGVSATQSDSPNGSRLSLTLRWSDGRLAQCEVGYGRPAREAILVVGSGRLWMNNPYGRIWRGTATGRQFQWGARLIDSLSLVPYVVQPARSLMRWTTLAALRAFFRGIRTGRFIGPGFDDAIRVAKLLAAAEESLRVE